MSFHSRTSSEIESVPIADILPVFTAEFCKDFEFQDIQHHARSVLNANEFEYIIKEEGKSQIFHLLWVLQNKSDGEILHFLDCISYDYKWIVDNIKERLRFYDSSIEQFLEAIKRIRNDHQHHTDYNVHRTKHFMELRSALRSLNVKTGKSSVVLLGELGSGKKWLAIDVCSEFTVLQAMNFKIFWIDTIYCNSPEEDLHALNTLMLKLNPDHSYAKEPTTKISYCILQLQKQLREQLKSKEYQHCLLVLINVQNIKTLAAFNLGCKRLIITRNKKVSEKLSPKMNRHISLEEGLTVSEFRLLLDKYIKKYNWQEFASNETDIYYLSNGDPYLLSIIAKHLREKKSNWMQWQKHLENLQIPDKKFKRDIEISLGILSPQQLQQYAIFAIFPHCVGIPVTLLAVLWNTTLPEAEEIVYTFHKYSFVKRDLLEDNDTTICYLKFVYSSYIKTSPSIQSLINCLDLHRKIIDHYRVQHCLNVRTEVDLFNDRRVHDKYFFKYIGYHLMGAEYWHLFPKIYLDFGFLGQKMRKVGLLSTIADLKNYKHEISGYDSARLPINEIVDFLAKVEEKVFHVPDTSLLQYALMSDKPIQELALKQIEQFPRRSWFLENGNFHQRRFIVNLMQMPKKIRLLAEDLCIIVLENNETYMVDISLNCSCDPILIIRESAANIIDICLFGQDNYMLTLDDHGQLRLWHISSVRKRSLTQRRDSTKRFNPLYMCSCPIQMEMKPCRQRIDDMTLCKRDRVVAFHLEMATEYPEKIMLHVALKNGDICVLSWCEEEKEFQRSYVPILQTNFTNIRYMCKILRKYYMLVNNSSSLSFWNLQDCSNVPTSFEWPQHDSSLVSYEVYSDVGPLPYTHILFVFTDKILSLDFQKQRVTLLNGELTTLLDNIDYQITCAKLSSDRRYLILGTKTGLVVYDACAKCEILRSIISEYIRCVDVYDLDDNEYKCMVVCGVKNRRILYLLCLRKTSDDSLGWQHNYPQDNFVLEEQTNIRLLGQKLFDNTYADGCSNLIAVDSKNRIHQISTSDTKNWSIIKPAEAFNNITSITACEQWAFAGYDNGLVLSVYDENIMVPAFTDSPISYLKLINQTTLVAASSTEELTLIKDLGSEAYRKCQIDTRYCYPLLDDYLLLINNFGAVVVLDCSTKFKYITHLGPEPHFNMGDCDFQNNVLLMASSTDYRIRIVNFTLASSMEQENAIEVMINQQTEFKRLEIDVKLSCLAVSSDASLVAVGLEAKSPEKSQERDGDIEVFKMMPETYELQYIYCLKSHKMAICDMRFSPCGEVLVSIAEQLCIWNINHVLNNPLSRNTIKRRSSRFSSHRGSEQEEVDANLLAKQHRMFLHVYEKEPTAFKRPTSSPAVLTRSDCLDSSTDSVFVESSSKASVWEQYVGPARKPELLTCIKFDGNQAEQVFANEDFTQFNTIDNEGAYYNLTLLPHRNLAPSRDSGNETSNALEDIYTVNGPNLRCTRPSGSVRSSTPTITATASTSSNTSVTSAVTTTAVTTKTTTVTTKNTPATVLSNFRHHLSSLTMDKSPTSSSSSMIFNDRDVVDSAVIPT